MISLHAICRFELATKIPPSTGYATFEEISQGSGLSEAMTRRLLRHAISHRIFHEPEKGIVTHSGASKYLAENPNMRQWIAMVSEEMWPAATKA